MKVTFKDLKLNFAADICGEGKGEAQLHLAEGLLEASPSEIMGMVREALNERRHRETIERIRARRWARRDDE